MVSNAPLSKYSSAKCTKHNRIPIVYALPENKQRKRYANRKIKVLRVIKSQLLELNNDENS